MDIDDIQLPLENKFGQNFKQIENQNVQSIIDEKFVYIEGFQYDKGAENAEIRIGEEKGSQIFIQQLPQENLYLSRLDIGLYYNPKMLDVIKINFDDQDSDKIDNIHKSYTSKISNLLQNKNSSIISIGGSLDQLLCYYEAKNEFLQDKQQNIIVINASSKLNCDKNSVQKSVKNVFHQLNNYKNCKIYNFGVQNSQCQDQEVQQYQNKNIYWLESDIRRGNQQQIDMKIKEILQKQNKKQNYIIVDKLIQFQDQNCLTISSKLFVYMILQILEEVDCVQNIIFSLNLDILNSKVFPGVSEPSVIGGLTCEELMEITSLCAIIGIKNIVISGFNPAVEQIISVKYLINIVYQYCKYYRL